MLRVSTAAIGDAANPVGGNDYKDLRDGLRELASPIERGEKIMVAIDRAARRCEMEPWRAFNIWYGKARHTTPEERDAVSAAVQRKRREAARNEFHELKTRLAILESRLAQVDEDFHRETITEIRKQRR